MCWWCGKEKEGSLEKISPDVGTGILGDLILGHHKRKGGQLGSLQKREDEGKLKLQTVNRKAGR